MDAIASFRKEQLEKHKTQERTTLDAKEEKKHSRSLSALSKKRFGGEDLRQKSLAMYKSINNMVNLANKKDFAPIVRITKEEIEGVVTDYIYREMQNLGPLSKEQVEEIRNLVGQYLSEEALEEAVFINQEERRLHDSLEQDQDNLKTKRERIQFYDAPKVKGLVKSSLVAVKKKKSEQSDIPKERNEKLTAEAFSASSQGQRKAMEDQHLIISHLNELLDLQLDSPLAFYAVYDGHSGKTAAEYSRMQLHLEISRDKKFVSDLPAAISSAFVRTDLAFNQMALREGMTSGTTGAIVFLCADEMIVANVGDSEIVLCRNNIAHLLTEAHLPNRSDEKERIHRAGGTVVWYGAWRVNGLLSVSRSIGDPNLRGVVVADPFVLRLSRSPGDQFLLLATDGLWDVLGHQEACDFVLQHCQTHSRDSCCQALVEEATRKSSPDNVAVILVFLD